MKTEWDYTAHAAHYDKRADYSREAIIRLLQETGCRPGQPVADIGAGTGKLTKELLSFGLTTKSVEPNDAMRGFGIQNTKGQSAFWSQGTGEQTGLADSSVYAAFFGSSFNVVDQQKCLIEVARILVPGGWFGCMWNHRDLDDPTQMAIEDTIKRHISGYSYGLRREDPRAAIAKSGLFAPASHIEGSVIWPMPHADIITAWRSHATLRRQAGSDEVFEKIIGEIERLLAQLNEPVFVPYSTRIYYAQLTVDKSDLAARLYEMANAQ